MKPLSAHLFCVAILTLAFPVLGLCTAVEINGSCISGDCTTPDSLTQGTSTSGSTNTTLSLGGTNNFDVSTSFDASFPSGTHLDAFPIVTYIGSSPLSSSETVTLDFLQDFLMPGSNVSWDGTYHEDIPLSVSANGSASAQLLVDGQSVGLVGPVGPGTTDTSIFKGLTGLSGNTLSEDYQVTFTFGANTAPGSSISSVPEPGQTIPLALGMLGCVVAAFRRRQRS
jgi:hypothetical protein